MELAGPWQGSCRAKKAKLKNGWALLFPGFSSHFIDMFCYNLAYSGVRVTGARVTGLMLAGEGEQTGWDLTGNAGVEGQEGPGATPMDAHWSQPGIPASGCLIALSTFSDSR